MTAVVGVRTRGGDGAALVEALEEAHQSGFRHYCIAVKKQDRFGRRHSSALVRSYGKANVRVIDD